MKMIKDLLSVAFGSTIARGIALANTVIIARLVSPAHYGIFSIFYTVMILTWQIPESFDNVFVSLAKKTENPADKIEFLKSSMAFKLSYLIAVLVLSYPIAIMAGRYCFDKPNLTLPLVLALLCGAFLGFLITIAATYQEQEQYARYASFHAIYTASIFIALIGLYLTLEEVTLNAIYFIYVTVSLGIGLLSIFILVKRVGTIFKIDRSIFYRAFGQAKWMFFISSIYCIFARIDILFLPRFVSYQDLGHYAVAAQLVSIVALAAGPLAGICLPKASLAIQSKEAFRAYLKDTTAILAMIVVGMTIFYVLAPYIVTAFYGDHYSPSIKILRILLIGWAFNIGYIPFSFLFMALEDTRTRFFVEFVRLLICVILLNIFVPIYGNMGAAYAFTLTVILSAIMTLILLHTRFRRILRKHSEVA